MKKINPYQKLAQILRTDPSYLKDLFEKLEKITGKKKVAFKICQENQLKIFEALKKLNLDPKNVSFSQALDALISKAESDDYLLRKSFNFPKFSSALAWQKVIKKIKSFNILENLNLFEGYFLKEKVFEAILKKAPPRNILKFLGYRKVSSLLKKENLFEILSALRFAEGSKWLNHVFLSEYQKIKKSDFEKREVKIIPLSKKWQKLAKAFIEKKYHNISHLKEAGIIYIIPEPGDASGKFLRDFSLIFHYLFEISFYNKLFQSFFKKRNFASLFIKTLKGEDPKPPKKAFEDKILIIQRYYAKEDPYDRRLFLAHINSEVFHWKKAIDLLAQIGILLGNLDFSFWKDLGWVGDYFRENSSEALLSFDLIDNVMSLVKEKEGIKYLYHHQEALWNKIFEEFFGKEKLEELVAKNWEKKIIFLSDLTEKEK